MMICSRCHIELNSEAAARRHFAETHTDEQPPVVDLSLSLYGLTRAEAAIIVRLVERMRAGGDVVDRLRGRLLSALADAAELDGNRAELAAIEALA
jgi:hypothetical protein